MLVAAPRFTRFARLPAALPLILALAAGLHAAANAATVPGHVGGTLTVTPNTFNRQLEPRFNELVTIGVPLAGCVVTDVAQFRLFDETGTEVPLFVKPTLYWPAGREGCATSSARALKVQFVFDATRGDKTYTWDLGGRNLGMDRAEAPVSEIVTDDPIKDGRSEPRVFGILDPHYLVATGIAPPAGALTGDAYDAAFYPITWNNNSRKYVYNESLAADWLFDRVSTNYRQALRTGEPAYYREAYLSHEWYISRMEVTGANTTVPNYCLGGFDYQGKADTFGSGGAGCDTKYIYLEAYKLHLALTGDDSWTPAENGTPAASGAMNTRDDAWRTIAHLLVTGSVRGGSVANQPAIPAPGFIKPYDRLDIAMTERDLGFGLQNVQNACELTLDATICGWVDTVVGNIRQMQVANPDGIQQYGYLSHSLRQHEGDFLPWLGSVVGNYAGESWVVVNNVVGEGIATMTAGKWVRIGRSLNARLTDNAWSNGDGTWTLPLSAPVTVASGTDVKALYLADGKTIDFAHPSDRIFSPWMQAITADGVWQYYNWKSDQASRDTAASILLGFGRAYAAYALDGTRITAKTKNLIEGAFTDYGPISVFDSGITAIACAGIKETPYTRYFANSQMTTPSMNRSYGVYVFGNGGFANEHISEGIFQLALGVLFETDPLKRGAMISAVQDMRHWFYNYSCSANLTKNKRLYNWENKADPFGTVAYVRKALYGY